MEKYNLIFRSIDDQSVEVSGILDKDLGKKVYEVPDSIEGKKVVAIGEKAFEDASAIEKVVLPETIISIKSCAFSKCEGLKEVILPNSLKSIGLLSFFYCTSLKSIRLPANIQEIDSSAFDCCKSLERIEVEEKNQCFSSLDGVLFSKDTTTLIRYPEGKPENKYSIPVCTKRIGEQGFYDCINLRSVTVTGNVEIIDRCAFDGCKKLDEVNLSEGLKEIRHWAFRYCNIEKIVIPNSVNQIEADAFYSCNRLSAIYTEENPSYKGIDGVLFENESDLFMAPCLIPANYVIPEGTTAIKENAFSGCLAESITIPSSVISIYDSAFSECENL